MVFYNFLSKQKKGTQGILRSRFVRYPLWFHYLFQHSALTSA